MARIVGGEVLDPRRVAIGAGVLPALLPPLARMRRQPLQNAPGAAVGAGVPFTRVQPGTVGTSSTISSIVA
ncbi:hypothetical protein [Amycolatopsis methanolica]|uniref:hypothetical protein n=1 Tax=Amycolatopsis methanolica TaxID=1814 RepID=UPI00343C8643